MSTFRQNKYLLPALILVVMIATGFFFFNSAKQDSSQTPKTVISAQTLEEQYGLRVNLIAVTAAGGLVDLRLKIVDAEKAKQLLQDKKNFPALFIPDENVTLNVPEDTKGEEIEFVDESNIFLMYPNAGNVTKRGTMVTVIFGDIALEDIEAK